MVQVLFNSLIRASELALLAVGLTMVYSLLRFPNFAHVAFATAGAYIALSLSSGLGLHLGLAGAVAIVTVGGIAIASDRVIFSRLRTGSAILLMITSFALEIIIRETVRAVWGPSPFFYDLPLQRPVRILGAAITPTQLGIIVTAVVCMVALHLLLSRTILGISMRAVADNPHLAQASGIDTERVIRSVWFIGGGFAALGGILIGLDTQLRPDMGIGMIIPVFAAAILGGIGQPYGAMLGAMVLAFAENLGLSIDWHPLLALLGVTSVGYAYIPVSYQPAISFVVLLLILLARPTGLVRGKG